MPSDSTTATTTRAAKHQSLPNQHKLAALALPDTPSSMQLASSSTSSTSKADKIKRSGSAADKEALLQLPETQSREIFSAHHAHRIPPLVNLPAKLQGAARPAQADDDVETDDTDVEDDLFDKLDHEPNTATEAPAVTQNKVMAAAATTTTTNTTQASAQQDQRQPPPPSGPPPPPPPRHPRAAPGTIALPPNSVFTFPSNDYFSPGAPFLAAGAPLTPHPELRGAPLHTPAVAGARLVRTPHGYQHAGAYGLDPETPTISVRIAGTDVIQDVILSPMVEPSAWLQQHHHHHHHHHPQDLGAAPSRENCQTRASDEESLYGAHAFPLRPPPHLIRSRRTSRLASQHGPPLSRQDQPPPTEQRRRRRSSQLLQQLQQEQPAVVATDSEQQQQQGAARPQQAGSKSTSGTSAVSPRFMALRKLSESGMLPPPPPPPSSPDHSTPDQQHLLRKIDEIVESRLKESVSEVVWHANESNREARRFYEDQKREIMDLGASILARLDRQLGPGGGSSATAGDGAPDTDDDELDGLRKQRIELESEINAQQLKVIAQASEMEVLKEQIAKLSKQLKNLQQHKGQGVKTVDAELQTEPVEDKDQQQQQQQQDARNQSRSPDWADVVDDDEIWERKYHELESKYTTLVHERPDLEKRIAMLEQENRRLLAATPPLTVVDQPTATSAQRRLGGDRPRKHRSMMAPPVAAAAAAAATTATARSPTPPAVRDQQKRHTKDNDHHRQSYFMDEDGHLTFTTEINGRLSQYTVKVPTKDGSHHHHQRSGTPTGAGGSSRLNPNATPWKAPA